MRHKKRYSSPAFKEKVEPNSSNQTTTNITWLNTGKVKTVSIQEEVGGVLTEKSHLEYLYDATGNRVAKIWKADVNDPVTWQHTYYVNDASGNKMSIYKRGYEYRANRREAYRTYYDLEEQLLYGSDRLGSVNSNTRLFTNAYAQAPEVTYAGWDISTKLNTAPASTFAFGSRLLGTKEYDLTDHLGNVTVQLSDRKTGTLATGNIEAQLLSYQQYYPFGWEMPGRSLNGGQSRFGFNGKEDDEEWGIQDYGFRLYENRVGRFLSVDPLTASFPWWTPYQFAGNTPLQAVDLDGLEIYYSADGSYIDKWGTSKEVRILRDSDVEEFKKDKDFAIKNPDDWVAQDIMNFYWTGSAGSKQFSPKMTKILKNKSLVSASVKAQKSPTFIKLQELMKDNISIDSKAKGTYTVDATGNINIDGSGNIDEKILGMTWEMTNSKNHSKLESMNKKAKEGTGDFSKKDYVMGKMKIEAEAFLNQAIVSSELGIKNPMTERFKSQIADMNNGTKSKEQVLNEIAKWGYDNAVTKNPATGKQAKVSDLYGQQYDKIKDEE